MALEQRSMNVAMGMRDELAKTVSQVPGTGDYGRNQKVGKQHAKTIAEALIAQGLINLEALEERHYAVDEPEVLVDEEDEEV